MSESLLLSRVAAEGETKLSGLIKFHEHLGNGCQ